MTKSATTYPNAAIDALAENSVTPYDIVCELEEAFAANFIKPQPFIQLAPHVPLNEIIANDPVMGSMAKEMAKFAESRQLAEAMWQQKLMIYRNFGRYGLEKDEEKLIERAKDGLESIEDRLAAGYYAVESVKSRKAWKAEQSKHQTPSNYADLAVAKKEKVGDAYKWVDSVIHELPPATKGKAHAKAYYAMKLPDGRIINLGASQGSHAPILNEYPSRALRNVATRLGIVPIGGDTAVLNQILEAPLIEWANDKGEIEKCYKWLPSYTSAWQGNVWLVYIGWKLNPKCTNSSYWLDANGVLTQRPQDQAPLTVSQLDYEVIKGSAEEKLETEEVEGETEVADFMNDEEEYVLSGLMRDESDEDVPIDNFVLIGYAYENNRFVEHRNDSAIWKDAELRDYKAEELRKLRSEKRQLARFASDIEDNLSALELERIQNDEEASPELLARWNELHKMKQRIRNHEKFFVEQCRDLDTQTSPCYSPPESKFEYRMRPTEAQYGPFPEFIEAFGGKLLPAPIPHNGHNPLMEKVKTLPCMFTVPDGDIEQQKVTRCEFKPWPTRTFQMNLEQAKKLRRQKQVAQAIIHNRFGMLIREKAAAQTFASTLDALLS